MHHMFCSLPHSLYTSSIYLYIYNMYVILGLHIYISNMFCLRSYIHKHGRDVGEFPVNGLFGIPSKVVRFLSFWLQRGIKYAQVEREDHQKTNHLIFR